MKVPRFFSLEELLDSSTARQKSLQNSPSWTVVEHLNDLACFLDGIREAWGSGLRCSSGFRCPKLNTAVNGATRSAHLVGFAADISPVNGKMDEFEAFLKDYLKDKQFDECLWESRGKSRWVHIATHSIDGKQRRKMFGIAL